MSKEQISQVFEKLVVRHCAPTLAGLKTGAIVSWRHSSLEKTRKELGRLNRRLAPKGLRVIPLRQNEAETLIYLYRPHNLVKDLTVDEAVKLLKLHNYPTSSCQGCIKHLKERLGQGDFPHEIGLFLGYPPCDVSGFIEHKAKACKFCGYWKVYGNVEEAMRLFGQYKRCTALYEKLHARGKTLEELLVCSSA